MDHSTIHFATVFMAFFAIMNPIANAPLFLALTDGVDNATKRKVATHAVLLAFVIIAVFALVGREIFNVFGITLPAFRIAGGCLIALVGYHMLQGEQSSVHSPAEGDRENSLDASLGIAITPLALPMLAGPGSIATVMNFAAQSSTDEVIRVLSAYGLMCIITWITYVVGESITRFLGQNAIKVITRLMGMILAVIGVQMLITGIQGAFGLH
ncbi:MAG: MarC family protein [Pseudomonadota bacterium]